MKHHIAIIGGGLAGLSLSIDLRQRGYDVVVIEKGEYPRHKVCGEYISKESRNYLEQLCPSIGKLKLPDITHFKLSSTGSKTFQTKLDLGGFGISRYMLEFMLYNQAIELGVSFMLHCKALSIQTKVTNMEYIISTNSGQVNASLVCNATGRKSNFETKKLSDVLNATNYVGVKYHVKIKRNEDFIEIHNFPGGYCGISSIENNLACMCYIVNSKLLKASGNSIPELERNILQQNLQLKNIYKEAEFVTPVPITISGINFLIKNPVTKDIIYLGDSAGSIAPITGNGMSMALRSASYLAASIHLCISGKLTVHQLKQAYTEFWNREFCLRIKYSRYFQKLSEFPVLTNAAIRLMNAIPPLAQKLIRQTHGQPF